LALLIFGPLALISLIAADGRWRLLFVFTKPATTLSLLLVTGMPSQDRFGVLVVGALLLSALGDTALLFESAGFFMAGLLLFLLAHAAYTCAFLLGGGRGPLDPTALVGLVVVTLSTIWLLHRLWPRIERGLKVPVLIYGVAISIMVGAAYVLLGGPWPSYITVPITAGAVSFYLSDAILAWCRFRQPLPMQQTLNLAFYWTGQLGIALGARWVAGG
jgi:alkenylglycerophosphocholine hydrolase